jgi:hypothetical protein
MVFKWKIVRPPFHQVSEGVEVMHPGMEVEFETGSIAEAHGIYQDSGSALGEMFGSETIGRAVETATRIEGPAGFVPSVETDAARKKREKQERKNAADPSTANAPAPLVIPGADAPPIAPAAAGILDDGIPEALRRTAAAPVTPPPPAPPAPPAAPPTGILAGKITAELDKRATGAADGGQALADWLATSGITIKGATYAEAVTMLRLQADEKLGPIAQALGVA